MTHLKDTQLNTKETNDTKDGGLNAAHAPSATATAVQARDLSATALTPAILQVFEKAENRPMSIKQLSRGLGLTADERGTLRSVARELADDGVLLALPLRKYRAAVPGEVHTGTVSRHRDGYGWLKLDDAPPDAPDAFIPVTEMQSLLDGDRVRATLVQRAKGPLAEIVTVIERQKTTLVGVFRKRGRATFVELEGGMLGGTVLIPDDVGTEPVEDGMVVEVEITRFPTDVTGAAGRVLRHIGKEGELSVEIDKLIVEAGIERAFWPEAKAQADALGDSPDPAETAQREDLRDLPLCTIDGATAKDFDDAVHARRVPNGFVVTVAIADVSHYVKEGSPLDISARDRATSVYYPGKCIPMLPESLSNGLCSLKPNVDRLCLAVEMRIDNHGRMKKARFIDGVMHSHARLTYKDVQAFMDGDKAVRETIPSDVRLSLVVLADAARALRKARHARGALDFDIAEAVVALDDAGEPVSIHPSERLESNRLIEDLMVAANEAVAQFFERREWPTMFRVHAAPDPTKVSAVLELLGRLGALKHTDKLTAGNVDGRALSRVLERIARHPAKDAAQSLTLRAMKQAQYDAENVGHFGLASEAYLHFTSPIRRYPDLVVHRQLRAWLRKEKRGKATEEERASLEELALHCSERERRAAGVERQVDALHAAWFMRDKIGDTFHGRVVGCAEFGLFVRLDGHHVEGMVHVSTLGKDYYYFDAVRLRLIGERTGESLGVGDAVAVDVVGVDVEKRRVEMRLSEVLQSAAPVRRGPRAPRLDDGGTHAAHPREPRFRDDDRQRARSNTRPNRGRGGHRRDADRRGRDERRERPADGRGKGRPSLAERALRDRDSTPLRPKPVPRGGWTPWDDDAPSQHNPGPPTSGPSKHGADGKGKASKGKRKGKGKGKKKVRKRPAGKRSK